MRTKSLSTRKAITLIVVLGFALAVLTGCGIGHGPYRHGYDGYHGVGHGNGYRDNAFNSAMYYPNGSGYARHTPGYGDGRNGYCGW